MNNPEKSEPNELVERNQVESAEKIPIKINDFRDPNSRSFDLGKFIIVVERLRKESLFDLSREFEDSDYGKYMRFSTSESNYWDEAIKSAGAIEITLTNPPSRGMSGFTEKTSVELKILMSAKEGRVFRFNFSSDGKYLNGGWDDVHLQKRLGSPGEANDFELMIDPEPKKLK
jgi:hypothetical protein